MAESSKIEWTDATWNPAIGCDKISPGCKYCVDPSTEVLMSDFTTKPIASLKVGDAIIAFDERSKVKGHSPKIRLAYVQAIRPVRKKALIIETAHSKLICSYDHGLLMKKFRYSWIDAGQIRLGDSLNNIGYKYQTKSFTYSYMKGYLNGINDGDGTFKWNPYWRSVWKNQSDQCYWKLALAENQKEALKRVRIFLIALFNINIPILTCGLPRNDKHQQMYRMETRSQKHLYTLYNMFNEENYDLDFMRGYLSGIFDAEGSFSNKRRLNSLRISNTDSKILNKILYFGKEIGYDFRIEATQINRAKVVRLYGQMPEKFRFMVECRPAISYKRNALFDTQINPIADPVKSVSVYNDDELTLLIDIQTTTGTFIANNFLVHNCYMMRDMGGRHKMDVIGNVGRTSKATFNKPLSWQKKGLVSADGRPYKVFTASLTDIYHESIDSFRDEIIAMFYNCPDLIFQVLTKRIDRVPIVNTLPPNVWLGVSVESNDYLWRIERLINVNTNSVRFLSIEPLLSPLDVDHIFRNNPGKINWVILGGESGNETGKWLYRPSELEWYVQLMLVCKAHKISVFMKQTGTYIAKKWGYKDRHGRDISEWPKILQVREFPKSYT